MPDKRNDREGDKVSNHRDDEQARIEARHPILKNAARKGLGFGIVVTGVIAVVAFVIWSSSALAPIGVAYSAVGAIPWLIGIGALLLAVRIFTRKK